MAGHLARGAKNERARWNEPLFPTATPVKGTGQRGDGRQFCCLFLFLMLICCLLGSQAEYSEAETFTSCLCSLTFPGTGTVSPAIPSYTI